MTGGLASEQGESEHETSCACGVDHQPGNMPRQGYCVCCGGGPQELYPQVYLAKQREFTRDETVVVFAAYFTCQRCSRRDGLTRYFYPEIV
jgi:hypothetical protein